MIKQDMTPIWHSVSCLCSGCIAADNNYIGLGSGYLYWLTSPDRPMFGKEEAALWQGQLTATW